MNASTPRIVTVAALLVLPMLTLSTPAPAQTGAWQVISGERGEVISNDLPEGTFRQIDSVSVGDSGARLFGFRVTSPNSLEGYWASRMGRLTRYTQLNVGGALGPGRSGVESPHVFLAVNSAQGDAASDGQRAFVARAADPANVIAASYGVWRWDGVRNIEIARASTDGALGPGLGAGTVFANSAGFAQVRMLGGGAALINATVNSPGLSSQAVLRHTPALGNQPCLLTGSTNPALAPGLVVGDSFAAFNSGLDRLSIARDGRIRGRLTTNTNRGGIWELCNGAPRAVVIEAEAGARGPDVGVDTATFTSIASVAPQPAGLAAMTFFADWRFSPTVATQRGLFRHDGVRSRGIAYNEASGFFGPNYMGATWRSFDTDSLSVAEREAAFVASVDLPNGGTVSGIWRVSAGARPELLALISVVGAPFDPEAGRTWRSFDALVVLNNGEVVVQASSNPNNTRDFWLLASGQPPRRLLSSGQVLNVPTAQGNVQTAVSSFGVLSGGARYADGTDSWIGSDGTFFLGVNTTTLGSVQITQQLEVPNPDTVFKNGF